MDFLLSLIVRIVLLLVKENLSLQKCEALDFLISGAQMALKTLTPGNKPLHYLWTFLYLQSVLLIEADQITGMQCLRYEYMHMELV